MNLSYNTMDDYEITKDGRVINKKNNHELKPYINEKGYAIVTIMEKQWRVHRLVAERFIPNPENKPQVNHIDGDKTNNCVENLEWVTNKENRDHAVKNKLQVYGENCPWAKLNEENVRFIREHRDQYSISELANMFNVQPRTVWDVIHYVTWKNTIS